MTDTMRGQEPAQYIPPAAERRYEVNVMPTGTAINVTIIDRQASLKTTHDVVVLSFRKAAIDYDMARTVGKEVLREWPRRTLLGDEAVRMANWLWQHGYMLSDFWGQP